MMEHVECRVNEAIRLMLDCRGLLRILVIFMHYHLTEFIPLELVKAADVRTSTSKRTDLQWASDELCQLLRQFTTLYERNQATEKNKMVDMTRGESSQPPLSPLLSRKMIHLNTMSYVPCQSFRLWLENRRMIPTRIIAQSFLSFRLLAQQKGPTLALGAERWCFSLSPGNSWRIG